MTEDMPPLKQKFSGSSVGVFLCPILLVPFLVGPVLALALAHWAWAKTERLGQRGHGLIAAAVVLSVVEILAFLILILTGGFAVLSG